MGGFIPQPLLEQIRAANDIVDVIGAIIPLKRAGINFVALCPFHREKTPSFNVNPRKQIFHCFGCHKGGDVFAFVRAYENIEFVEAVKRLADRARIPLQFDNDPASREKKFLKDKLLEIHEQLTLRWQGMLQNDAAGERARQYLKERGVSEEAVKLFRLGYASESWEDTVNWAKSKNYPLETLEEGGLLVRKEGTNNFYGRFRARLMFPICDEQGQVIGFSGRILPGDDDNRKYVNSPETPLFHKSRVMFGLDKSRRALIEKEFAVICEGQLDLIAIYMAGIQNVVAPQGTAFTAEHAAILKRHVKEVVLCFDSDGAGQKATVRVLDFFIASGLAIRVAKVPSPHDPDSYIKDFGAAAFLELIQKAEGFFDYYLAWLCSNNDINSDLGQQTVVRAMAEAVQKTTDLMLLDKYARKTAARLGVSPANAVAQFKKPTHAPIVRQDDQPTAGEEMVPERPNQNEFWLLKLVFLDDELIPWVAEQIDLAWIQNATVRKILEAGIYPDAEGHTMPAAGVLNALEDQHAQSLLSEALAEDREIKNRLQQLTDLITRLRNAFLDKQITQLVAKASLPETPPEESQRLLEEQLKLREIKRRPVGTPAP
jgi:DNA primase